MRRLFTLVGVSALLVAPASAQHAVALRFEPPNGLVIRRVFQEHVRITVDEGPGSTPRVRETAQLGGVTQSALEVGDKTVLHVQLDSLRVREREAGGDWRERAVTMVEGAWVQLDADDRMQLALRGRPDSLAEHLLVQLVAGVRGTVLPERPVRRGMQWRGRVEFPVGTELGDGETALTVRMTYRVDSIVARAHDTLVYLGLGGDAVPHGERRPDGTVLDYRGTVTGALVWSTGWSGIVSAATRFSVQGEIRSRGAPEAVGRVHVDRTLRQVVLPESP
ncbi:MAG: hypothetical protein OER90_02705 [Gemmatimonadota bacterium]|nr:hypothetical protein [Gemmatimonadota bacterium]